MTKVRYATLMREPGPGAVPKQGLIECGYTKGYTPKGHYAYGWADYSRKLSEDEVNAYELEYVRTERTVEEGGC